MQKLSIIFIVTFSIFLASCSAYLLDPKEVKVEKDNFQIAADSVVILPQSIKNYILTNFPKATIKNTARDKTGMYLVTISTSNLVSLLAFDAVGNFKSQTNQTSVTSDAEARAKVLNYIKVKYSLIRIKQITKDKLGNFKVIIQNNNTTSLLCFNAEGVFQSITTISGTTNKPVAADSAVLKEITSYLNTKYASAIVKGIEKGKTGNFYVTINLSLDYLILTFDAKGIFVSEAKILGQTSQQSKLDSAVVKTITTYIGNNFAGASVKNISKDAKGNYLVYINHNNSSLVLSFDSIGKFLKSSTIYTYVNDEVINKINNYIKANYPVISFKSITKDVSGGYTVVVKTTSNSYTLLFSALGDFIS